MALSPSIRRLGTDALVNTRIPFDTRRAPDPRRSNIALDANALNRHGTEHDALVDRFEKLSDDGVLHLVLGGGVRDEVQHPNSSAKKKAAVLPQIFNLRPGLTTGQRAERQRVAEILQGNAHPGTHAADASHLSQASETGCSYFITHDRRILRKRDEFRAVLPSNLWIVSLQEFFRIFDDFITGRWLWRYRRAASIICCFLTGRHVALYCIHRLTPFVTGPVHRPARSSSFRGSSTYGS
jgi:hypothetical protein